MKNVTVVFNLGTVLSAATGILLTDIGNFYKILNYMTGESLFTHQLPRVSREMSPIIFQQHPQLKEADVSDITTENWKEKLEALIDKYGLFDHKKIDPFDEAKDMMGGDESKIIIWAGGLDD